MNEDVPAVEIKLSDEPRLVLHFTADGITSDPEAALHLPRLLVRLGLASSASEATRKIKEQAVRVNENKVTDTAIARNLLTGSPVLRLGKRAVRVLWR